MQISTAVLFLERVGIIDLAFILHCGNRCSLSELKSDLNFGFK